MRNLKLYYATNRRHAGSDRWKPTSYGTTFSSDGLENLRFGRVTVRADAERLAKCASKDVGFGIGDGNAMADYLSGLAGKTGRKDSPTTIRAFRERLDELTSDLNRPASAFGSRKMFADLQKVMLQSSDVLIFIHGYNVAWNQAVGSALALQEMLNRKTEGVERQKVAVVLFTWPSDGSAMPFAAYKSDRSDAVASGKAVGRGILKLRDFLIELRSVSGRRASGAQPCDQEVHMLCHSMGNYVLQNALARIAEFTPGVAMPRLFEHTFLCAPDVDDDVLEPGKAMGRLHELSSRLTVYFNEGDKALLGSDVTKGNPDRLGDAGIARPAIVHSKIHQVDCTGVVKGFTQHSYYQEGDVNADIRMSIAGVPPDSPLRIYRVHPAVGRNTWTMKER